MLKAIEVDGSNNQSMTLNAKSEGRANFKVVADSKIGIGKINVLVNGLSEKFTDVTEISVRPPPHYRKLQQRFCYGRQVYRKIAIGMSDFIPGSVNYQLVVSRSPALELGEHLRYLVQYPYGCTEQTVSAAFPQLYYGDLADLMQLNKQNKLNANTNIMEAIRKIKMRQLYKRRRYTLG
jgi:uncharacterized protein YfaS (alpha-2-macroglobulin family)